MWVVHLVHLDRLTLCANLAGNLLGLFLFAAGQAGGYADDAQRTIPQAIVGHFQEEGAVHAS
jgi:hypothetical protein